MERVRLAPRDDWRERVSALGLSWHTADDGRAYWDESAYWRLSMAEVDRIEEATAELYDMVLHAVGRVVEREELGDFGYGAAAQAMIAESWANFGWEPTLYGRFDLAYDGDALKMLEFNGDTPTSLFEAGVVQWAWMEERFPHLDQFNSIHDRLIEGFNIYREHAGPAELHLTCAMPHAEDEGTVDYLAHCANAAGIPTRTIGQEDIGWQDTGGHGLFVDLDNRPITHLFKLVPWEWLIADPFGLHMVEQVRAGALRMIEPPWKMVASHKRLLVTLKEMFPESPLLLDATIDRRRAQGWGSYVSKPAGGREGANVEIFEDGRMTAAAPGAYDDDLMVFQEKANLAQADGRYAVLGSWIVNREPAGLGIRESTGPITGNTASFVPHVIEG